MVQPRRFFGFVPDFRPHDGNDDYVLVDKPARPSPARSDQRNVSVDKVEEWGKEVLESSLNRIALTALTANGPTATLNSRAALINTPHTFSLQLPQDGKPITNQRSSGRCWLFASTNSFRLALMRKHHLCEFELSQAYLFFYDKLEKANFFLENVVETAGAALDGREVQALLNDPVGDGGQWDMAANLVEKYGLVPHARYPDAFSAANSGQMDKLLTTRLRADALFLRALATAAATAPADRAAALQAAKDGMVRDIHRILTLTLGPPPAPATPFRWEYRDADGAFHATTLTPLELAGDLKSSAAIAANHGIRVHALFSLVNDPRHDYLRLLTVSRLGNVREGRPITYVNVAMATMKRACVAMLRAGQPVFFGCDVGKCLDGAHGVMDPALVADYATAFGVEVGPVGALDKAQRLRAGESAMTHAMVLTGVHLEPAAAGAAGGAAGGEERAVRWRIENSWGKDAGDKGYYVMSDAWMDEFVYQAVVDPQFVDSEIRDVLDQDPLVLPLWDPMGALA